jgi:hypothetical protein
MVMGAPDVGDRASKLVEAVHVPCGDKPVLLR